MSDTPIEHDDGRSGETGKATPEPVPDLPPELPRQRSDQPTEPGEAKPPSYDHPSADLVPDLPREPAERTAEPAGTAWEAEQIALRERGVAEPVIDETPAHRVREAEHRRHYQRPDRSADDTDASGGLPPEARAEVLRVLDQRTHTEPKITRDMQQITADQPGTLRGLEHRLKGQERVLEKVHGELGEEPDRSASEVAAEVPDAVRYTHEVPDDVYSHVVEHDVSALRAHGYELMGWNNSWDSETYRGINSRWRDPTTGQRFEVQFHTPSSFFVKEDLTHGLYERYRAPTTSDREIRAIAEINRLISRRIPPPDGAGNVHYRPEAEREIDE